MVIAPSIFALRCGMMNPMAQTKPTSEELRAELNDLRSTDTRLIEQPSGLMERCAKANEIMTIAHRASTRYEMDSL